ncbi:MAG: ATP-grasp domain-containing protein [Actinophytocola sp.]|nr:ATP-grasp domain-containing protein [Actinophytocola sp.]
MKPANVFVLGLDEENLATMHDVPRLAEYRFHALLSLDELQYGEIPVTDLLAKAQRQLDGFDGHIDAIVGYWDFPVSTMLPILCRRYGLPSTSLESVLKCEHKYWSRLEQQQVIDEHPRFALVDLDGPAEPPKDLKYPMWLKPVKSFSSELAFKVDTDDGFREAIGEIKEGIGRLGEPFQDILDMAELPPEIADVGAQAVLAEEALSGRQAAIEGYGINGRVEIYGALDSLNYPGTSSFLRHQYPSQLPAATVEHMAEVSERVISRIGLEFVAFSIEFFVDPDSNDVWLLEINPRHSQSHAEIFDHVDGAPNHHCMLRLALGREPEMPHREGEYAIAAKYNYRRFSGDAVIRAVPSEDELARIEADIPGVAIHPRAVAWGRLSELIGQDSYSYHLADLIVAGSDVAEMEDKFRRATEQLTYEFEAPEEPEGG